VVVGLVENHSLGTLIALLLDRVPEVRFAASLAGPFRIFKWLRWRADALALAAVEDLASRALLTGFAVLFPEEGLIAGHALVARIGIVAIWADAGLPFLVEHSLPRTLQALAGRVVPVACSCAQDTRAGLVDVS
jgi:hypothetical protein